MKSLKQFNNVDKAGLLFQLFPEEIKSLVDFMGLMALTILEDHERGRTKWNSSLFTFDKWLEVVQDANDRIAKYGEKLYSNKRLFTDQLFDGDAAHFAVHCIMVQVTTMQLLNVRYVYAIRMLFTIH